MRIRKKQATDTATPQPEKTTIRRDPRRHRLVSKLLTLLPVWSTQTEASMSGE